MTSSDERATEPPPTTESLAQAAHLRRLSARIDELRTHTDQLTEIAAAIQQALEHKQPPVGGFLGPPPNWATMTADQAEDAWHDLADWITDTLVPWYGITRDQLPDCWALHRPVVRELSWLHYTYRAAHSCDAAAHLTADWHTNWRPGVLRRIHDAIPRRGNRSCTPGHHLATDAERIAAHSQAAQQKRGPATFTAPSEQLAIRTHWRDMFECAVAEDLEVRVGRRDTEHLT